MSKEHVKEDELEKLANEFCERHFTEPGKLVSQAFKAGYAAATLVDDYWEKRCKAAENIIDYQHGVPDPYTEAEIQMYEEWKELRTSSTGVEKLFPTPASVKAAATPASDTDMTAKEFYNCGLFNLEFMTPEEKETIYTATELYAKGKVRQATPADKPKIVCLCGSVKFAEHFHKWEFDLSVQGIITLAPCVYNNDVQITNPEAKKMFDVLHKRKIDLSDEVFVLNVGGYIGESTRNEINYTIEIGKPVKYLEP